MFGFFLLVEKKEVAQTLKQFLAIVHTQFNKIVKVVCTDNRTEFTYLTPYFLDHSIFHQTTMVHMSQQNGRVKRKHRHILNVTSAFLFSKLNYLFVFRSVF